MSTYQSKYTGTEIDERIEWAEGINPHMEDKDNPHEVTAAQTGAVATIDIVNGLTETGTGKVLDARQGRTLSDFIGDQTYTEKNYIADGESATSSIDKLDIQAKKSADLISTNSSDIEKLKQSKVKIYGVKFTGSNPVGERTHDAVGMVADVGVDDQLVRNDFDSVDFYKRPRCNIYHDAQGGPIIMAYEGEPGFSLEGAIFPPYADIASVFYECKPCAWNGSFEEPQVTGTPMEGFELFECFPDWNTKVYLPSYWMAVVNGKPTSISGVLPGVYSLDTAMSTARTYHANGHVETMAAHMYEYILQLVEFATSDVQTVMMGASQNAHNGASDIITTVESETVFTTTEAVGVRFVAGQTISIGSAQNGTNRSSGVVIESIVTNEGVSTFTLEAPILAMAPGDFLSTRAWRNGATDIVAASSGSPVSNTSGKYPCIWRGKVDPWAMAYSQICDLLIQRSGVGTTEDPYVYTPHYLPDPTKYAAGAITEDYTKLNLSLPIADGYAKSLGADKRFGFIGLTDMLGAASTTWLAAYYYYPRYEVCAVRVGGGWSLGRLCSPVSFNCASRPSHSHIFYLARLSVRRN